MDKKMTRQILFKPGKGVSEILDEKKNVQPEKIKVEKPKSPLNTKPEITQTERTKNVYSWLKGRPLFNLNGLCLKVGIDRANFVKGMKKDWDIKMDVLEKVENELKAYGYGK